MRRQEWLAGAGIALLAGLVVLWLMLPGLVAARWTAQLRSMGHPQAELAIDHLGWGNATGAFFLGGEEGADGFEATFTPAGLWAGRLSSLTIKGLHLSRPLSLSGGGRLPDMPLDGPVRLANTRLRLELPGGLGALPLTLDADLTPVDGDWRLDGKGALAVGPVSVPATLNAQWRQGILSVAAFGLSPVADGPRLGGQGNFRRLATGEWTGQVDVTAAGLPQGLPDFTLNWKPGQGRGLLEWKGVARLDVLLDADGAAGQRLDARLRVDDLSAFAARLNQPEPGLAGGPLILSLSAQGVVPSLDPRLWPEVLLRLEATGIGIGRGPRDNALSLSAMARRIDGDWWLAPTLNQPPGILLMPTLGLRANGLSLTGRAALPLDLDLRAAGLRLPWLAPSTLMAKLRGQPGDDLRLEWQAAVTDTDARLSGSVDMVAGGGNALVRLAPLRLGPGDVDRVFPGAPLPSGLTGTIAARLSTRWGEAGAQGAADILVEDGGVVLPGLHLAGINGVVRLDRLSPLSMPAQTIAVGLFDPGIALTGGSVGLSLQGDGLLRLAPTPFTWAGQSVIISPSSFRIGNDYLDLRLELPATPLPNILSTLGVTDLEAEGTVIGSIPVRITAEGATTGDATLRAVAPGRLALRGDSPLAWLDPRRNDNLALLARALTDYRFRSLELNFTGRGTALALDGANPSLYGGYAMPINLVLAPAPAAAVPTTLPAGIAAAMAAFKARRD